MPTTPDDANAGGDGGGESSISLGLLASSPHHFARSVGATVSEVEATVTARKAESAALHHSLAALEAEDGGRMTPAELGKAKHSMICRHRYEHMRKPFVCRKCWTYDPVCVCHLFEGDDEKARAPLPRGVERVVVWTHHDEWGRTSNTGSLLPLGLEGMEMLMKGLEEHDEVMDGVFGGDCGATPVVLWPGKGIENATTTADELLARFDNDEPGGGIVLVAIEGTWSNARRMANKLPPNVLRLDIGEEILAHFARGTPHRANPSSGPGGSPPPPRPTSSSPSLLAPLRRQGKGKDGSAQNVSTLEAAIIALSALGLGAEDADRMLVAARTKVDRLREYTGKVHWRP